MLHRVHAFLAAEQPAEPLATPLRELAAVIGRLETYGARQEQHHRSTQSYTTLLKEKARRLREDHLKPITMAAHSTWRPDSDEAEALAQAVKLPKNRTDYQQLVLAARGVATSAEARQAQLAGAGLEPDFIPALRSATDDLVAAIAVRSGELLRRVAATQGITNEARRGLVIVRLLNALMRRSLRSDPARLAEWASVIRRPARPEPVVETLPTPVVPGGAPAQAA